MNVLKRFDHFLLDHVFQPVSDFTQRHLGVHCLNVASLTIKASVACWALFLLRRSPNESAVLFGLLATSFCCMATALGTIYFLCRNLALTSLRAGYMNANHEMWWGLRTTYLVLHVGQYYLRSPLSRVSDGLFLITIYFLACTPLPPQKSTVRKFLESLVPSPAPTPVQCRLLKR